MTDPENSAPAEPEVVRLPSRMTPDVAEAALAFLERTTLQASEVEAFLRVRLALEAIAMGAR